MRGKLPGRIGVLALLACVSANGVAAATSSDMTTRDINVKGHHLTFHILPGHLPILVLDAGGGGDSSYWDGILPDLAKRTGSEIITYDRAGFGASDEVAPPYRVDDAVTDLQSGLQQLDATHDLILIPHSFAGRIATYLAIRHPQWLSGAVLVDTNVPDFFTKHVQFARRVANLRLIVALGSSHDIAHDHPEVILNAVSSLLAGRMSGYGQTSR